MPEFPDIVVYVEALDRRMVDRRLTLIRSRSRLLKEDWPRSLEELEG